MEEEVQLPKTFDGEIAVKLAAFAFAAYREQKTSMWVKMKDGTDLGR